MPTPHMAVSRVVKSQSATHYPLAADGGGGSCRSAALARRHAKLKLPQARSAHARLDWHAARRHKAVTPPATTTIRTPQLRRLAGAGYLVAWRWRRAVITERRSAAAAARESQQMVAAKLSLLLSQCALFSELKERQVQPSREQHYYLKRTYLQAILSTLPTLCTAVDFRSMEFWIAKPLFLRKFMPIL